MPLPHNGSIQPVIVTDADGNPARVSLVAGVYRLAVDAILGGGGGSDVTVVDETPGTTITTPADTSVGIGATVALPTSTDVRRMTVQNTGAAGTQVRIREVGAGAGRGPILPSLSSATYGEAGGAIAALEAQEIAGIATTVMTQFERD